MGVTHLLERPAEAGNAHHHNQPGQDQPGQICGPLGTDGPLRDDAHRPGMPGLGEPLELLHGITPLEGGVTVVTVDGDRQGPEGLPDDGGGEVAGGVDVLAVAHDISFQEN